MIWNVYRYDFNRKEIEVFNVFEHASFYMNVKDILKKKLSREELSKALKSEAMYYFWCKSEHEVVITSWPPHITKKELDKLKKEDCNRLCWINLEVGEKVDIYQQLMLNWDAFVNYIMSCSEV